MKYAITCLLVCYWIAPPVRAEPITTDTTIDFYIGAFEDRVRIHDGIDGPTTVEIVDGAEIVVDVHVNDRSVLNLRGGITQGLVAGHDMATLNIFGGLVTTGEDVIVNGHATANIYGGIFGDDIRAGDSATVNLYGGTFEKAGGGAMLVVQEDGVINVFGSNFDIDLDPRTSPSFPRLQGVLSDGSPLDVRLLIDKLNLRSAEIVLHEIPEPSACSLCVLALFVLLVYGRLRRRPIALSYVGRSVERSVPAAREKRHYAVQRAEGQ